MGRGVAEVEFNISVAPAPLTAPVIVALLSYWQEKAAGREMPSRRDIDPAEMRRLLPHIYMVDVAPAAPHFRFRLIGTEIVQLLGRDFTGRAIDEASYGSAAAPLARIMRTVVERRRPVGFQGRIFYIRGQEWRRVESVLLPLSGQDGAIDIILAGLVPVVAPAEPVRGGEAAGGMRDIRLLLEPRLPPAG